jgi:glucuronoarabinoxylan endo-1,4-beta-xylanase
MTSTAFQTSLKSFGALLLVPFFAIAVGAQNLATNPGFETGNTTGWFAFGSPVISTTTAQVHSGAYACLVTNRTATYMGVAQSFTSVLPTNQTCAISAWLRLASGTNQTMQLTMQKVDGAGTAYTAIAAGSVSTNGWVQLSGQYNFTYSGTLTSLVLYAEVPTSTNAAYYIDDLLVQSTDVMPVNGTCCVDWTNVCQRIDGFGASSAWDSTWTTAQADLFFSTNTGIGLSLLRSRIVYASSTAATAIPGTVENSIMQMAQARGARVWSTPWTPPTGFKNTNDLYDSLPITNAVCGGSYLGTGNNATNLAYASQLANYVDSMKTKYGVNIYAVSVQNEPDAQVNTYEACQWTGQQIRDFSTNLSSALAAKGYGSTKIIIPESQNWASNPGLWTPTLTDANATAAVSIIANHNYVMDNSAGDQTPPVAINTSGKALWQTEVALLSGTNNSITNAIYWAERIHLFLTAAQANAWHYWWLVDSGNGGLADASGNTSKRMYALGQFARFVRPDFYRVGVPTNSGSALVSAFKDLSSSNFAIVAINASSQTVTQSFNFINIGGITNVTPWITSAILSLSNQTPIWVTNSSFNYSLPALSVVTFVGQANTIVPPATTVTLASGGSPTTYGSPVTFTVTLKTNGVALGAVVGETIRFYDGANQIGSALLNGSGQAVFATTNTQLAAGTHSLTAGYGGDANYSGSTNSPAWSQVVNPAQLTYLADGTNLTYGSTIPVMSGAVSGFVGSDTQGSATTGTLAFTTPANATSSIGSYAVNGSGLTASNYSFSQAAGNATALTITAAGLTVTNLLVLDKVYDGTTNATLNAANAGLAGKKNGDSLTLVTTNATACFADPNVGSNKPVTVAGITFTGAAAGNYTLAAPTGLTANILPLSPPVFSGQPLQPMAGGWQLNFSGQPGQSYHVRATTNLAQPWDLWIPITNGTFGSSPAAILDPAAGWGQRYYRIISP